MVSRDNLRGIQRRIFVVHGNTNIYLVRKLTHTNSLLKFLSWTANQLSFFQQAEASLVTHAS